mmetsp:Transcript_9989/g.23663  ORF Transcript_9989/g.23663 Transcript_9989/m.23663 type:complete len:336 (+) Transcript_9989:199-1206(+)
MAEPPSAQAARMIASIYYADPNRVRADVADVFKAIPTLLPEKRSWTANTGATVELLTLGGTVPINFRGTTYHIPCRFFVTETYPAEAPLCYVEPTRDMEVKRGHAFVSPDGSCDTSFWNPSMKLIHMVQEAQRRFAMDPPVYARAAGGGGGAAVDKEALIRDITGKVQGKLQALFRKTGGELDHELTLQSKLTAGTSSLETGLSGLRETVRQWEAYNDQIALKVAELESWLAVQDAEGKSAEFEADEMVQPPDVLSRQLFRVTAEAAACTDAMYYLDKAMDANSIGLEDYLRQTGAIARQQFQAQALAMKISGAMRAAGYGLASAGPGGAPPSYK